MNQGLAWANADGPARLGWAGMPLFNLTGRSPAHHLFEQARSGPAHHSIFRPDSGHLKATRPIKHGLHVCRPDDFHAQAHVLSRTKKRISIC